MADGEPGILDGLSETEPIPLQPVKQKKPRRRKKVAIQVVIPDAESADAVYAGMLAEMNTSELVALVRLNNLRANRAVPREVLYEMILSGQQQDLEEDQLPVERMRDAVQEFLDGHPLAGANPKVCPRNCYLHPDLYVLHCHARMKDQLTVARNLEAAKRARQNVKSRAQPRLDTVIDNGGNDGDA